MAQDTPFSGPRVGGIIGYDMVKAGSSQDSDIEGDDQSADGFLYGIDAGYDVDLGRAVIGVEAEISDSTGKVDNDPADPNYFGFGRVDTGRDIYVGARVGAKVTPAA
jgi:outer membrane immunogenic protein